MSWNALVTSIVVQSMWALVQLISLSDVSANERCNVVPYCLSPCWTTGNIRLTMLVQEAQELHLFITDMLMHPFQHLRNYIHQHWPITAFWLVFSTFLYKKFGLNIGHQVINIGKSWCANVVCKNWPFLVLAGCKLTLPIQGLTCVTLRL